MTLAAQNTLAPYSKNKGKPRKEQKTLDEHFEGRMHGLDAEVSSPGADAAVHCRPAQAVHRNGTDHPAPMHTRDTPARIAVQGVARILRLLDYHLQGCHLISITFLKPGIQTWPDYHSQVFESNRDSRLLSYFLLWCATRVRGWRQLPRGPHRPSRRDPGQKYNINIAAVICA